MFLKLKNIGALFVLLFILSIPAMGQDTGFLLSGYASSEFQLDANGNSFMTGNFATTFVWSHSDRFLFEGELESAYDHGNFAMGLEYATMAYILNDYLTFRAGKFLSPFNTFNERMHPSWINKMPTAPLGLGHHDPVGPANEFGVELRGGARLGGPKINYSIFISNGPVLNVVEDEVSPSASINYTNAEDNNNNKAIGGRLGILPFDDSSLEVGISGHYSGKIGSRDTKFEDITSFNWSTDLLWHLRGIEFIRGNIDLRGQLNSVAFDQFQLQTDLETIDVNLDQKAYYGQLAYRPIMSGSPLLSNTELVVRFSGHDLPATQFDTAADQADGDGDSGDDGHAHKIKPSSFSINSSQTSGSGENQYEVAQNSNINSHAEISSRQTQWAFGINYWTSWRTVFKVSYQIDDLNGQTSDGLFIQFATGL